MNRELAEAVVECFQLGEETPEVSRLRNFNARDWQRTYGWLDRSGLALYLLRRLQDLGATELLPPEVRVRFERNDVENRRRLEYITSEFDSINQRFQRAGINFAVIKGFSLIPGFCPDVTLRAPSDLDYLVGQESVAAAQRALEEEGYCLQRMSEIEFKFGKPSARVPVLSDDPYSRQTEPLVELHLAFWNTKENRVALNEPKFRLDQTISHHWQGLRFPVLKEEDAFVLQVLHVFQHTLECWVKLCWLLEIGSFVRERSCDPQFWGRVDTRMREFPYLVEFAAVVMGLVEKVFDAPMPPIVAKWRQSLRPTGRLWLEACGRTWAIEDHPYLNSSLFAVSKLAFLLHREFIPDPKIRQEITRRRLFPWKVPEQIAIPAVLTGGRGQRQFLWRRLIFHLGSSLRYCWELPRWRRLARLQSHELL